MFDDPRPKRYGWTTAARYRTIGEAQIAEALLLTGWAIEAARGEAEERLQDARATLDRLVALGLPFRSTSQGRAFDPAEVYNFSRILSLEGRDPFWIDRCVRTNRALVGLLRADADAAGPASRRFTFRLRRTFNVTTVDRTKPLRFRLPLPIEDENLGEVVLDHVETDPPLDWRVSGDRCRLEARGFLPPEPHVSLALQLSFTTTEGTIHAKGDDWRQYLQPSEGLIKVTARVQALAEDLAGDCSAPRDILARFWSFLLDDLLCGVVHYDRVLAAPAAVDWVLDNGWFDCQLGASLLAALCRAMSIPARVVSGFQLYEPGPSYHFWTEVWFEAEGWVHYDLSAWVLSAGGHDAAWRDIFAGSIQPRMKTQCSPLRFTGFIGVAFPEAWHMLSRRTDRGSEIGYWDVDTGALVYRDEIEVEALDCRPS